MPYCQMKMNPRNLAKILTGALIFGLAACDQENVVESFDGRTISKLEIQYVGGNLVEENRLMKLIAVKAGDIYTPESTDSSIKTLWESGLIDDATFFVKPDGKEVIVIAKLKTRLPMGPTGFIGNTAYSDQKLAKESGFTLDEPITLETLETMRQKLKSFYVNNGYADAEVVCRAFDGGMPTPMDFIFVIEEGTQQPQPKSSTDH